MRSKEEISDIIQKFNVDRVKTFAEFIAEIFKDKYLEIYMGDSYEETKLEQTSMAYAAVFCGKVMGAYRECLIINSFRTVGSGRNSSRKTGNIVFLNERAIKALREVDGEGTINDLFIKSGHESFGIKEFVDKEKGK